MARKRAVKAATVDEYLAALSADQRGALERLRTIIRAAAPGAEECISYQLPAFRYQGRMLVWFGAGASHCALYPGGIVQEFERELAGYATSKGTIRFQPDKPLPAALVRKIVKARVGQNAGRPGLYVALLRGINVGTAKRIPMADLRAAVERLGFDHCRTVLNSGNLVFAGRGAPASIAGQIERAIASQLGVSTRVTVLTAAKFTATIEDNHLPRSANDPSRVLVAFARGPADLKRLRLLQQKDWKPEVLVVGKVAAYLWCPAGTSKGALWKAVGGDGVTTRNWATVMKLREALRTAD